MLSQPCFAFHLARSGGYRDRRVAIAQKAILKRRANRRR